MDIIKQLFEEHGNELTQKLESIGFSSQQATDFLPEAALSLVGGTQNADMGSLISQLSADPAEHFNIEVIAQKLELNSDWIAAGISAIAAVLLPHIMQKNSGIGDAISGLASRGSLFSSATKMFS